MSDVKIIRTCEIEGKGEMECLFEAPIDTKVAEGDIVELQWERGVVRRARVKEVFTEQTDSDTYIYFYRNSMPSKEKYRKILRVCPPGSGMEGELTRKNEKFDRFIDAYGSFLDKIDLSQKLPDGWWGKIKKGILIAFVLYVIFRAFWLYESPW